MLWVVGVVMLLILLGQLILALYVNIDAKRRQLETPSKYFAGVSIPIIGLLVFVIYRSYRDEFARREPLESERAAGAERGRVDRSPSTAPADPPTQWTIRVSGLAGVPRRFAYSVAGMGRLFYGAIVVVPTVLLVGNVAVHGQIAVVYFSACAGLWMLVLSVLSHFSNTTVSVRRDAGELLLTHSYGDHVLTSDPSEECIDLGEVAAVVLTPVDGWTIARIRYDDPLTVQHRMFAVPTDQPAVFGELLDDYDIAMETRNAWLRIGTAALSLGIIPIAAAVIWPGSVFSGPVLVLLAWVCIWIATKSLET